MTGKGLKVGEERKKRRRRNGNRRKRGMRRGIKRKKTIGGKGRVCGTEIKKGTGKRKAGNGKGVGTWC